MFHKNSLSARKPYSALLFHDIDFTILDKNHANYEPVLH